MPRLVTFMAALLMTMATAASAETVGFAQVGTESDWRTAFSADMKAEAKARGIDLRFDEAGGNVERQFAAVRRYIAERVDAIIIAPAVVTGWTPVLEEAQAAHIPVFIADRSVDADPSLFVARIAADFNLEGRLAASWLAQASRGGCAIVELEGLHWRGPNHRTGEGFRSRHRAIPWHAHRSLGKWRLHRAGRPAGDDEIHRIHRRVEGYLRCVVA
jgi:ABC-type sugar transport system substrate-binding protein